MDRQFTTQRRSSQTGFLLAAMVRRAPVSWPARQGRPFRSTKSNGNRPENDHRSRGRPGPVIRPSSNRMLWRMSYGAKSSDQPIVMHVKRAGYTRRVFALRAVFAQHPKRETDRELSRRLFATRPAEGDGELGSQGEGRWGDKEDGELGSEQDNGAKITTTGRQSKESGRKRLQT